MVCLEAWVGGFKIGVGIWLFVLLVVGLSEVGCVCEVWKCHGSGGV